MPKGQKRTKTACFGRLIVAKQTPSGWLQRMPDDSTGGRDVVFRQTFIIPAGEVANLNAVIRNTPWRFEFLASKTLPPETATSLKWAISPPNPAESIPIVFRIELINWSSSLTSGTAKPTSAGTLSDGTAFGFNLYGFDVSGTKLLTFELYFGGTY
jgi:hypothetical protein